MLELYNQRGGEGGGRGALALRPGLGAGQEVGYPQQQLRHERRRVGCRCMCDALLHALEDHGAVLVLRRTPDDPPLPAAAAASGAIAALV
mmetsp:Transcript_6714/g.17188  ORF Transcript_6714/g.17188 Transcript_6714/m.17188 type:complete len:90 (+) Transcript_6714:116-385(+)